MPVEDNANIEVASRLGERPNEGASRRRTEIVEIVEAVLLAFVAVATAFSGFQAAKWDGVSSRDYADSSRLRVKAEQASLTSSATLSFNSDILGDWLVLNSLGDAGKASLLVRRFTPNYRVAFDAWLKTRPLSDPSSPPGPRSMPQYKDPLAAKADALDAEADHAYETAVGVRETSDKFVRLTVILAAVLFLVAIGQRFHIRRVRLAMLGFAAVFLVYAILLLLSYPLI
jgi:hypothetical protein